MNGEAPGCDRPADDHQLTAHDRGTARRPRAREARKPAPGGSDELEGADAGRSCGRVGTGHEESMAVVCGHRVMRGDGQVVEWRARAGTDCEDVNAGAHGAVAGEPTRHDDTVADRGRSHLRRLIGGGGEP